MIKDTLKYIGLFFLVLPLISYLIFARKLSITGEKNEVCKSISVDIADKDINRFIHKDDILDILSKEKKRLIGKKTEDINLFELENLLADRSAIKYSQVCINRDGELCIEVTQRRPLLRIEGKNGGFYIDETMYIFPLVKTFTSYVPIVSGNIPIKIKNNFRGRLKGRDSSWVNKILHLANCLDKNPFWGAQIQQIYVNNDGEIALSPRVGGHNILFGHLDYIEVKFRKLDEFYKNVIPTVGWNKYHTVNLKYKNQIICK